MHTNVCTHTHTYIYTIHTRMYAYVRLYTYTYIHIHHTYTYVCIRSLEALVCLGAGSQLGSQDWGIQHTYIQLGSKLICLEEKDYVWNNTLGDRPEESPIGFMMLADMVWERGWKVVVWGEGGRGHGGPVVVLHVQHVGQQWLGRRLQLFHLVPDLHWLEGDLLTRPGHPQDPGDPLQEYQTYLKHSCHCCNKSDVGRLWLTQLGISWVSAFLWW